MNCLIKFSAINLYFVGNHNLLDRGENSYYSKNVLRVVFDPQLMIIKSKVKASMKSQSYDVEIHLTNEFNVEKATCTCPRGLEICHHIAAAMFASRYDLSKTDIPCTWTPSPASDNTKSWKELYNIPVHNQLYERSLSEEEINQFGVNIRNELCCGFGWILKHEPDDVDVDVAPNIALVITETKEPNEWMKKLAVSDDEIKKIANATVGQTVNTAWINVRRHRITASNFGALIGSINRNRYPASLFNRLIGQTNLDHIKAVQWGRTHENEGIKALESYLGKKVTMTGIWLSKSGMLGASPDGFVEDSVVEVKCRYKSRQTILSEDLADDDSYIIRFNKISNVWIVNEKHDYFHQIQGQIHITNTQGCYLVVWTPGETAVVYIEKKAGWSEWLKKMEFFFVNKFVPYLKESLK